MDATGLTQEQYNLLNKIFEPSGEDEETPVEEFLAQITTPEELHQLAWNYNWDDGNDTPNWIIRQPFCDRGTALLLYWKACPRYFCQYANRNEVPGFQVADYDFVKDLEKIYFAGFYTQANIAFDPANHEESDFTKDYLEYELKQEFPAIMLEPTPGKVLERASF